MTIYSISRKKVGEYLTNTYILLYKHMNFIHEDMQCIKPLYLFFRFDNMAY